MRKLFNISFVLFFLAEFDANAEEKKVIKLPEIKVSEQFLKDEDSKYHKNTTNIGKSLQATKDIPQSLTIISSSLMKDRNVDSLQSALRNVGGISFFSRETGYGKAGDNFSLRGNSTGNDLYLDGLRDNSQYFRDTFNTERVEVLKGSSSMLFGRGSIGGIINQASKEPDLDLESNVNFTAGNFGYLRETADISKNIGKKSAIRINIMKTDSASSRDHVDNDSFGFAPSLKFGIGTENEFLLSASHLNYSITPDYGIPIRGNDGAKPIQVPNDTFYGFPNSDKQNDYINIFTTSLDHKFNKTSALKTTIRKTFVKREMYGTRPSFNGSSLIITRQYQGKIAKENSSILQSNYTSKFKTFNIKHDILIGGEYVVEKSGLRFTNIFSGPTTRTNPIYPDPRPDVDLEVYERDSNNFKSKNLGFYAQDLFELSPKWKLLIGTRYDDFRTDFTGTEGGVSTAEADISSSAKNWSYRSGLLYQPNEDATYYISQGSSFNLSGATQSSHPADVAEKAGRSISSKIVTTEIGAKFEFFENDLSLKSALFHTKNYGNSISQNSSHIDGIELEAIGKITKKWEIFSTASFLQAKIDENENLLAEGLTPRNTPSFSGTVWSGYNLSEHFKIGAGANFMAEREGYSIPSNGTKPKIQRIPGYVLFDAMTSWTQKQYKIQLNLINLFDTEYYDSIHANGSQAIPGAGRTFRLSLSYSF